MKKINFKDTVIMGCIPVKHLPKSPPDQSTCVIEECPECSQEIWVSEKKLHLRESFDNAFIYCFICIFIACREQGVDMDLIDITGIEE